METRRGVRVLFSSIIDLFTVVNKVFRINEYDWYFDEMELNYFFVAGGRYDGREFINRIDQFSNLSFVRIRRYSKHESIMAINTYKEYIQSNCLTLILFYDGGYCDIYDKSDVIKDALYRECSRIESCEVECILENDIRESMYF